VATRLERLKVIFDDLREEARDLDARQHDPEQMGTFVRSGAAALERLLKRIELPGVDTGAGLYRLVEALRTVGLADDSVLALHALRTAANADKHDPQTFQDWQETDRVLRNVRKALDDFDDVSIAALHQPADRPHQRIFVVTTYDYFHTGETEFYVWPMIRDYTRPLEIFQLDYHHEANALARLEYDGELSWGKEAVGEELWTRLAEDSAFYRAGLFSGTYRDLVAAFAPHQHGLPLLAGLNRSDNFSSVRSGLLMALVDLTYDQPEAAGTLDLDRLLDHAASEYALAREHPAVKSVGERVMALVAPLSADERAGLKGPQWRAPGDLQTQARHRLNEDIRLSTVIRDDYTIMVGDES
jgi:hypothetical protein